MKALTKIQKVSEKQVAFGRKLGIDLSNGTIRVAVAKIEDLVDQNYWERELRKPTEKQIELATKFGYDISRETHREGSAVIDNIMEQLNLESIDEQNLRPGDAVINKWDSLCHEYVISTIRDDGLVFFKGGNGKRAWARNLIKVDRHDV